MRKVNIAEKFSQISEFWKPHIAAELNGQYVKLAKIKGEFVFHHHEHEDELFLVVRGRFRMEFRDRPHEWVEEGEFIVVPHGVEHKPVAEDECWFLDATERMAEAGPESTGREDRLRCGACRLNPAPGTLCQTGCSW